MISSIKQYAIALYESLKDEKSPEKIERKIFNFAKILKKNNDFKLSPKIIKEFEKCWNKEKGIVILEIKSANPVAEEKKAAIKKLFNAKQKQVEIKEKIDKNLIGGAVLKIGDIIIDNSVKNHLQKLWTEITS